jgi:hypothetical protein
MQEHIEEDAKWNTDASLYADAGATEEQKIDAVPMHGRAGMMIQDVLLPGYRKEWEKSRSVSHAPLPLVSCPCDFHPLRH